MYCNSFKTWLHILWYSSHQDFEVSLKSGQVCDCFDLQSSEKVMLYDSWGVVKRATCLLPCLLGHLFIELWSGMKEVQLLWGHHSREPVSSTKVDSPSSSQRHQTWEWNYFRHARLFTGWLPLNNFCQVQMKRKITQM